ncbi:MAG TPA: 2-C-methyl-D-erythritol 4-phosphate cytidylyltransferase [Chloroflexota bacterium]|nr:2-C-methyl-D-erythritol 4-phosphate cytidylyltransferase [Chloroflexota bacterium]
MDDRPAAVGAIIVAAGSSRRMGGPDKLWIDLGGRPLLARTIAAIAALPPLAELVVVGSPETLRRAAELIGDPPWSRVDRWVAGGATRQDSVFCGLEALGPHPIILVHDGARPLVRRETLERGVVAAQAHGAALAAIPVTDTTKVVDQDGRVRSTLDRTALLAAQTPQVFAGPLLRQAYERIGVARAGCTDDAAVVELAGLPVYTFPGERDNLKVSTQADLALVRALWAARMEDEDE